MKNPFHISRKNLQILLATTERRLSRQILDKMLENYSREEISGQLVKKRGPIIDVINMHSVSLGAKTENVEVITALGLSDFYWPHSETEISFELKSGVISDSIISYKDLIEGLENDTHIDCQIQGGGRELIFQIKRYPMAYLGDSNEAFLEWLREKVIKHYGNMQGTILAILIQPEGAYAQSQLHLHNLALSLASMKDKITFDKVVLTYNDKGQYFALHELYPEEKRTLVPLEWGLKRFRGEV